MKYSRIADLREDDDTTQAEIAEKIECGLTSYRRYEKGDRDIPLDKLILLAKNYNVSLDYLLGFSMDKGYYQNQPTNIVKLKLLRQKYGYTQKQISKLVYCSEIAYIRYENGQKKAPTWLIFRLAKLYKLSVNEILF